MEVVHFFQMHSDQAVKASEISGAVVLLIGFFAFVYGGRDPSPAPSSSCGSGRALRTGETEQGDFALLFEV